MDSDRRLQDSIDMAGCRAANVQDVYTWQLLPNAVFPQLL
jgi:hypothetical protein